MATAQVSGRPLVALGQYEVICERQRLEMEVV